MRNHAFTVLALLPPPDFAPQLRLLQLRNPHAKREFTGAYSDCDGAAWTPELRAACGGYDPGAATDDGVFWMPFDAFLQRFDHATVTPLVVLAHEGGPWHKAVAHGEVAPRRGGDWVEEKLCAPQFLLFCEAPSTLTLQLEAAGAEGGDAPLGLAAFFHEGGDGRRAVVKDDFFPARPAVRGAPLHPVDSPFEPVPEGALEGGGEGARAVNAINGQGRVGVAVRLGGGTAGAGAGSLVVFPQLAEHAQTAVKFCLTVLCEGPFSLRVAQPGERVGSVRYVAWLSAAQTA